MEIRLFFDWCKNGMIGVHIVNKMVSKEKEPAPITWTGSFLLFRKLLLYY